MFEHFVGKDALFGIAVEHRQHELLEEFSLLLGESISILIVCLLGNHHIFEAPVLQLGNPYQVPLFREVLP